MTESQYVLTLALAVCNLGDRVFGHKTKKLKTPSKGQLISKSLFSVFNSPKKRMKTIRIEVQALLL